MVFQGLLAEVVLVMLHYSIQFDLLVFQLQSISYIARYHNWIASGSSRGSRFLEVKLKSSRRNISQARLVINEQMSQLFEYFESRIKLSLTTRISDATIPLLDKVEVLENKVALNEAHFNELDKKNNGSEYRFQVKMDDNELYSSCSCLRLYGPPLLDCGKETSSECRPEVMQVFQEELQIPVTDEWFEIVHRIGKVKALEGSRNIFQAIMLKLNSWKQLEIIYCGWENVKDGERFCLDLKARRAKLLMHATEKVKTNLEIKYAFAAINYKL